MADLETSTVLPSVSTDSLRASAPARKPLDVPAVFCPIEATDPFSTTEWDLRTAAIKGENGEVLFEQTACEIPAAWSQLATNVVVSK